MLSVVLSDDLAWLAWNQSLGDIGTRVLCTQGVFSRQDIREREREKKNNQKKC
jgi:hypothetical protein